MDFECFNHIFNHNFSAFTKKHNMSKEVQQFMTNVVHKSLGITFHDLAKLKGPNLGLSIVAGVMRNILGLPKRNSYFSV